MSKFQLGVCQMIVSSDKDQNIGNAEKLIRKLLKKVAKL